MFTLTIIWGRIPWILSLAMTTGVLANSPGGRASGTTRGIATQAGKE